MAEQQNKRLKSSKNPESSGGKKPSSVLAVTCSPAATLTPAAPSPFAATAKMPKLAAPSPVAMAKPIIVTVKSTAASPSAGTAPGLVAPSPVATKATPAPSPKALVEPEDGGALEKTDGAVVAGPPEEKAIDGLTAKNKEWLHCAACPSALKPPISMCRDGHAVCSDCAAANKHCGQCGGAATATYTHVPCMDRLVGTLELACPYNKFGCRTSIAYHAVADHRSRCAYAPCYCLQCTPRFEGSPASLVRHLTDQSGRHRWPEPEKIEYRTEQSFVVPAASDDHRRLLVAEEDGGVFLLAVGACRGEAGVRPFNIVCVRGNGGARPVYKGTAKVKGPTDEGGDALGFLLFGKMASCVVPGEVDMAQGRLHAHVNPAMLHGESKELHLDICIEDFP